MFRCRHRTRSRLETGLAPFRGGSGGRGPGAAGAGAAPRVASAPTPGQSAPLEYRLVSGPEMPSPSGEQSVVEIWAGKPPRALARGVRGRSLDSALGPDSIETPVDAVVLGCPAQSLTA